MLFAAVHSLFASTRAKRLFESRLGQRRGRAVHRLTFIGQSAAMLGALGLWFINLPDRGLYRLRGFAAVAAQSVQAASFLGLMWVFASIGLSRFLGASQAVALLRNETPPATPEAQGPAPDDEGHINVRGPFKYVRHPYNLGVMGILWFFPHMTVNRLALAIASSVYTLVGSLHEEQRLRTYFGRAYDEYAARVPANLPRLWKNMPLTNEEKLDEGREMGE